MIEAQRLGHIVLAVRDMKKSADFYCRTIGFEVAAYSEPRGQCFLSFGDDHHTLGLFQRAAADGRPPDESQPGIVHIAFLLDSFAELRAAFHELRAMGIEVERTVEHNVTRSLYFRDPDNNCIELFSNLHENGFEAMQTTPIYDAPLDVVTGARGEIEYI